MRLSRQLAPMAALAVAALAAFILVAGAQALHTGHNRPAVSVSQVIEWPPAPSSPTEQISLGGRLALVWGDGLPGTAPALQPWLFPPESGSAIRLVLDQDQVRTAGGWLALDRQMVSLRGRWTAGLLDRAPALQVESVALASAGSRTQGISGPQPWVSILCKFADDPAEPRPLTYFDGMYSTDLPGLDHYWREQSYQAITLTGSKAVGWYTLPHPRSYYVYDRDGDGVPDLDHGRAARDCTAAADADLFYPDYVGLNLMFNATLDCCAWGGAWWLLLDGVARLWYVTWEPPWGYQNVAVISHEMGHGFGLPHSSGPYGEVYDNQWDVMSDLWSGCYRGGYHGHPVYGCLAQHTIGYHKDLLGWIAPGRQVTLTAGSRATITLTRLALPPAGTTLLATLPFRDTSDRFYTVEARQLVGYDGLNPLPGAAVIIHQVDPSRSEPAHVLDVDGDGDTGDQGAMWLPGETMTDPDNGLTVTVQSGTAAGYVVKLESQAIRPASLSLTGPGEGLTGQSLRFFAAAGPITATQPISYFWQASGQAPLTHTAGLLDSATFVWRQPGSQSITVTAVNWGGALTATHPLEVIAPLAAVTLTGPAVAEPGVAVRFYASASPLTASLPISYTWLASGHSPLTRASGLTDTAAFSWTLGGERLVTVTAANRGGLAVDARLVSIWHRTWLPLILRG